MRRRGLTTLSMAWGPGGNSFFPRRDGCDFGFSPTRPAAGPWTGWNFGQDSGLSARALRRARGCRW